MKDLTQRRGVRKEKKKDILCVLTFLRLGVKDLPQRKEGSSFSVEDGKAWGKTFLEADTPLTKKIILRVGSVLGR
ncbi:MAG: hypothetical protein ACXWB9_11295 [Flavisolibacter sp.]